MKFHLATTILGTAVLGLLVGSALADNEEVSGGGGGGGGDGGHKPCMLVALTQLPQCAQKCFMKGAPDIGCHGTDFACQCAKKASLMAAIEGCVKDGCPEAKYQAVIDGGEAVCDCVNTCQSPQPAASGSRNSTNGAGGGCGAPSSATAGGPSGSGARGGGPMPSSTPAPPVMPKPTSTPAPALSTSMSMPANMSMPAAPGTSCGCDAGGGPPKSSSAMSMTAGPSSSGGGKGGGGGGGGGEVPPKTSSPVPISSSTSAPPPPAVTAAARKTHAPIALVAGVAVAMALL